MNKHRFRLARVLRVRQIEHDRASAEVAAKRVVERDARSRVATLEKAYANAMRPTGPMSYEELRLSRFRLDCAAEAVRAAESGVKDAGFEVAQAVGRWRTTRERVRALEKLERRSLTTHAHDLAREERRENDEMSIRRFGMVAR